jgi:glycerol-3-phosphate acyltransferase PlsY
MSEFLVEWSPFAAFLVCAYLLGAFPTSYIVVQLSRGVDLREQGSKNLGATNVFRVLGWKYALPVGLIDIAKGALPVRLGMSAWHGVPLWIPLSFGVAAVVGHMFSPWVHFRGGKGVATAGGVFLAVAPLAVAITMPVWSLLLWLTGYVSVSSIVAVALFPVWVWLARPDRYAIGASVVLAALIILAHRPNIARLLAGTELRFRTRPATTQGPDVAGPPHA